ncbi:MAG TPA: glycosyltransferase family 1 protein [Pyrinomonadaceae bacterium]|nr:glycosyltransferase family 1 protein [Pyrinomonadaceae bacterium]
MLIGLDAIPLTEPLAGVGHYTSELARALARSSAADEFELAYPSTYPPLDLFVVDKVKPPSNLKAARVNVGAAGRHWWSLGLPRYVSRRGIQLFHGTNYDVPLWRRCATVLTVHDLSLFTRPETHEARRVWRARRRLPLMARTATLVITPTEAVRREVCERLGVRAEKVCAVHEAARGIFRPLAFAATADTRRRLGAGEDFLLAVGTIEPRKNLRALVRAFESIVRETTAATTTATTQATATNEATMKATLGGLRLVVAGGKGWLSDPLFDEVARSPVKDRIVFTGYVTDEDLRALYSSCRLFAYPSLYEGFGLPVLEAMQCGAPVLTSRTPALSEVAGAAALLVNPDSPEEIARGIVELLGSEAERRRLSGAGLERAAEFSWERAARQTLEVYAEASKRFRR